MRTLTVSDPAIIGGKPSYSDTVAKSSPVGYWPLTDSTSTMKAVVGNDGTYSSVTFGAGPVPSLASAPVFNGSSSYGAVSVDLSALSTITISVWLWWDTYGTGDKLALEHTTNANSRNAFQVDPDDPTAVFVFGITGGGSGYRQGSIVRPSAGAWHHYGVIMRRDGSLATVYVDGVAVSVSNRYSSGTVVSGNFTNSTLYLMSRAGLSLFGAGRMSGLAIFPSALTAANIKALATAA